MITRKIFLNVTIIPHYFEFVKKNARFYEIYCEKKLKFVQ